MIFKQQASVTASGHHQVLDCVQLSSKGNKAFLLNIEIYSLNADSVIPL